ncbi:diguanylate cyclase with PAS/PAC sensor [Candidatus Moduliflexus flocculans]|uniref:Diguanylate cyclase with PAS/PAC sensor n=1 Tax=Candidatus Moduliflexus flocculans TaxID=1499966 RepID=A0A081BSC3_9BACT|nr:diguanylate cyclase with PAS/PAC sensor [Candidatus Moduliflexus flocculans]
MKRAECFHRFTQEIFISQLFWRVGKPRCLPIFMEISNMTKEMLRELAERYQSVIAVMAEGVVVQLKDGSIVECNESAEHILGLTRDQMMKRTSMDPSWYAIHEDGSPFPGDTHPAMVALRTGEPCKNVIMGVHKLRGELTWISINANPIFHSNDPCPYAVVTTFHDVTAHKGAEQAIQEREAALSAMSQASHDALITINSNGKILFWNPAAERIFGYAAAEVSGCDLHELLAGLEEQEQAHKGLLTFAKTGTGAIMERTREVMARHKDGHFFPVELSVASYRLNNEWLAVGSVRDITARKEAERKLQEMAMLDGLTGILNRRYFLELSEQEFKRCRRYHRPLSLIMFDIDHFKQVNDTYGHDAGDTVLQAVTQTGRAILREADIFGRIGGEEFAITLPETNLVSARHVADRLRCAIGNLNINAHETLIHITSSMGVAGINHEIHSIEMLLKCADQALYRAKNAGRNRVETFG